MTIKSELALFVGGANDGKRMAAHDLPIVRLPLPHHQQTSMSRLKTEEYRKERIVAQNCVFEFYVSSETSTASAISLLLASYTPKAKFNDA